jgi:hypothetical protein
VRRAPVFPEVNTLPDTEVAAATRNGYAKRTGRQNATHMRGHVIRTLIHVTKYRVAIGHEPGHEAFQIGAHLGIGVLAQHQRGTGVVQENETNTGLYSGFGHTRLHLIADRVTPPAPGAQLKRRLKNHFILPFV